MCEIPTYDELPPSLPEYLIEEWGREYVRCKHGLGVKDMPDTFEYYIVKKIKEG